MISEQLINNNNFGTLNSGDVLLIESKAGWLDRIIKFIGRSEFTHTAMLVEIKGNWFVVEARPKQQQSAYQMMPVDWWVEQNKDKEAYIGKMPTKNLDSPNLKQIEERIKANILNPKWSLRPYKLRWCAIVVILQEFFGIKRPIIKKYRDESEHPMICSTIVQDAWENAGVIDRGNFKSPGDIAKLSRTMGSLTPFNLVTSNKNNDYIPDNYRLSSLTVMQAS